MNVKTTLMAGLLASGICGTLAIAPANAGETRKVTIVDDGTFHELITRVYTLKHAKAADLTPFVLGAVKSMRGNTKVDRLNFKAQGTQHLVVTMEAQYASHIDDLVAKLDRPGLLGTGIHNFTYNFKNRTAFGIFNKSSDTGKAVIDLWDSGDATYHQFDSDTVVWKDSKSDGSDAAKYFEMLDVPVPTAEFEFNVYEVSEDDIKDLGMDYKAWFTAEVNEGNLLSKTWSYTKDFGAGPNDWGHNGNLLSDFTFDIDSSFLRFMQEKGKAKITNTAKLVLKNGTDVTYGDDKNFYKPVKDDNGDDLYASITLGEGLKLQINRADSTIFNNAKQVNLSYKVDYTGAQDTIDIIDGGANKLVSENAFSVSCDRVKIGYGDENVVASLVRQHEVEEYVGMPFLSEIPVVKYLFGTETTSKTNVKMIITCKVRNVTPKSNMTEEVKALAADITADVK